MLRFQQLRRLTNRLFAANYKTYINFSTMPNTNTDWYLSQKDASNLDVDLLASGYSLDQLMELAGLACAIAIHHRLNRAPLSYSPDSGEAPRPIVVLCGPGNNGGDGLVCARHLALWGHSVDVYYPRAPSKPLFAGLLSQCSHMGIRVFRHDQSVSTSSPVPAQDASPWQRAMDVLHAALARDAQICIVDAVFGFGGRAERISELKPPYRSMLEAVRVASDSSALLACLDVPSGWDVEKGDVAETGVHPDLLISLTAPKRCAATLSRPTEHVVGGRFVPPHILRKYNLPALAYADCEQVLEL